MSGAIVADIHMKGAILVDKTLAWENTVDEIIARKLGWVNLVGDLFDKSNIADREASLGTIYRPLMDGINRLRAAGIEVEADQGNHDMATGSQLSALEPLKDAGIRVIDTFGQTTEGADFLICHIPWIADMGTRQADLDAWLSEIKRLFKNNPKCKIITGHAQVKGVILNSDDRLKGGIFEIDPAALDDLGADFIFFGDIHKRQPYYVGAMSQKNFGEAGNPQGFVIIDTAKKTREFVEIDAPKYLTVDTVDDAPLGPFAEKYVWIRGTVKPQNYDELLAKGYRVDIKPERTAPVREVAGIEAGRSDEELLDAYLKSQGRTDDDRQRIAVRARELAGELR